jgi:hypothetical protein
MFGLCGLLGLSALVPLDSWLTSFSSTIFLVYGGTFFIISLLSTRVAHQSTHPQPSITSATERTVRGERVWHLWLILTSVWVVLMSVFIVYPAIVSGVYHFSREIMWERSFPNMPAYIRAMDTNSFFFIFFFSTFIYYPFTFYLCMHSIGQWMHQKGTVRRSRLFLLSIASLLPIVLHQLTHAMITWLVD